MSTVDAPQLDPTAQPEPVADQVTAPETAREPMSDTEPTAARIYAWLGVKPRNTTFSYADLIAAFPDVPRGTLSSVLHHVKHVTPDVIRATPERGTYRIWDQAALAEMAERSRTGKATLRATPPPTPKATPKAGHKVAHKAITHKVAAPAPATSIEAVRELVRSMRPGDELTSRLVCDVLGEQAPSVQAIRAELRAQERAGALAVRMEGMVNIYTLPSRGPVTVTAPVFEADADEVDVTVGFVFERLPASDIYEMADAIRANYAELEAHPGGTFRVAEYGGPDPLGTAEKRASMLAEHMDDSRLRFLARRRGEHHAGLYVAWGRE